MLIPQSFKNRAVAYRFLQDIGYKPSERTFYNGCEISEDGKSVLLSAVIKQLWEEYPPIPFGENEVQAAKQAAESAELDLEEKRLKVAKLKRADDHVKQLEQRVAEFDQQQAALIIMIYDTIRHHINLAGREIAHAAGADSSRVPEMEQQIEQIIDRAFNEIATSDKIIEMEIDNAAEPVANAANS